MRMKTGALVLGGLLFGAAALLPSISEGRGGGPGGGRGRGGGWCGQSQCRQLNQDCNQDRQRLRDGSCGNTDCPQTGRGRGNCYGPGDGTGNQGSGPKGGTGSGAPSRQ